MNKRELIWLKLLRFWDSLLVVAFFWVVIAFLLFAPRCTYIPAPPDATQTGR